jgi:ADP-ribosylglycohydrolase
LGKLSTKALLFPDPKMNRIRGAFFGQLIGDALGSRYEFKSHSVVQSMLEKDTVDGHLPLLGNGPIVKKPGQVTDDSEMTTKHSFIGTQEETEI